MNKQQLNNLLLLLAYISTIDQTNEQSLTDIENNTVFAGLIIRNGECILKVFNDYAGYMDGIQDIIISLEGDVISQFKEQLIAE